MTIIGGVKYRSIEMGMFSLGGCSEVVYGKHLVAQKYDAYKAINN